MSRVPDKDVEDAALPSTEPAGRVEVDSRGRNVWRWARDVIESTSVVLKRLENKDLSLEPTRKVPVMRDPGAGPKKGATAAGKSGGSPRGEDDGEVRHPALQRERRDKRGGGFDPYNSR